MNPDSVIFACIFIYFVHFETITAMLTVITHGLQILPEIWQRHVWQWNINILWTTDKRVIQVWWHTVRCRTIMHQRHSDCNPCHVVVIWCHRCTIQRTSVQELSCLKMWQFPFQVPFTDWDFNNACGTRFCQCSDLLSSGLVCLATMSNCCTCQTDSSWHMPALQHVLISQKTYIYVSYTTSCYTAVFETDTKL